ncbi:MAG: porin family protein [Cyclobacteriaceae bacterium]
MRFTFICLAVLCSYVTIGQTAQCTRRLTDAEEAFDQGRLQDVLDALDKKGAAKDCFAAFTIPERIRAEKLLTKAYLFTDNPAEAEKSLVDLLHVDKEHQLAKDDPAELHHLYSQFKTEPIFRVGFRAGINKSFVKVLQNFGNTQVAKQYNGAGPNETGIGVGFHAEALVERHIKNGIEIGTGFQFRSASYEFDASFIPGQEADFYITGKNRSSMLRVPLLARYNFNYDKKTVDGIRLNKMWYVFAGGSFDYVVDAQYLNTARTGGTAFTLNAPKNSLTSAGDNNVSQVARSNASIFGGGGLKIRFGRSKVDFITFEVRYDNSLFNYIDPANRYANKDLNIDLGFVEDDLTINTVSISVGYTKSFYKPTKRKEYR